MVKRRHTLNGPSFQAAVAGIQQMDEKSPKFNQGNKIQTFTFSPPFQFSPPCAVERENIKSKASFSLRLQNTFRRL